MTRFQEENGCFQLKFGLIKQSTNLKLKNQFLAWENVKYSHTHAHEKESTVRLTTRITMLWAPQRSLLYRLKDSIEVKCKVTHSATNSQLKTSPETVNLTENAERHTFKAPCCCFENAPNTDLLLFAQSM